MANVRTTPSIYPIQHPLILFANTLESAIHRFHTTESFNQQPTDILSAICRVGAALIPVLHDSIQFCIRRGT